METTSTAYLAAYKDGGGAGDSVEKCREQIKVYHHQSKFKNENICLSTSGDFIYRLLM